MRILATRGAVAPGGRRRPGGGAFAFALLALLGPGLPGCTNPFAPAEPEPPTNEEEAFEVVVDYATPEGVLGTLSEAMAAKARGNGTAAYMGSFADTLTDGVGLTVLFDPDVVNERQSAGKAIPDWTRSLEQQFYRYLAGLDSGEYTLSWTRYEGAPADDVDDPAGRATYWRQYQVYALASDGVTAKNVAWGRVELQFRKLSATRWVITRWEDSIDPAFGPDPSDPGLRSFSRIRIDSTGQ